MLKKTTFSLAVVWTVLIAVLCLAKFGSLPSLGISDADKYVHITFYFVFVLLWGFYSWQKLNEIRIPKIIRLVVISIFYGLLIEFLQETCTTTRHADIFDVIANFTGATIALLVFVFIKKQKRS